MAGSFFHTWMSIISQKPPVLSPLIIACLAATWLIWGSTYLAIRFALDGFTPFVLMGTRFSIAGALLFVWMRRRGAALPTRPQWRNAFIVGSLMLVGGMGGTATAELTVGSGLVVAFIAVSPLLLVLLHVTVGIYPPRGELLGVLVGLCGVVLLTHGAGFQHSPNGIWLLVIATSCWSLGSFLSQRQCPLAPGAMGFATQMLCGGVVLLVLALLHGESFRLTAASTAWFAWLYLTVFGSLIGFNAYMVLLSRASPGIATSYSYVNPIIAMLLGVSLGHETITLREWSAAGITLAGVAIVLISRRRKT